MVIAVKNEHTYVESAINSALRQDGLSHEVIVIDDGSTDDTFEILSRIATHDERLVLRRSTGVGKCSAFNQGVKLARGQFTTLFAGDDLMPPGSLAARLDSARTISGDAPIVGLCKLVTMSEDKKFDGKLIPRRKGRGALSGASPLMNRAAVSRIFPVPEVFPNEDTWMELAILHLPDLRLVHTDIIGCSWRCHAGNSINLHMEWDDYNRRITSRLKALNVFFDKHASELTPESLHELSAKVGCEKARSSGSVFGVLTSDVQFVDRLRALSITNKFMYQVRRTFFGLLSGW